MYPTYSVTFKSYLKHWTKSSQFIHAEYHQWGISAIILNLLVVGSNVEGDWQSLLGPDAGQSCVEGQLTDRNTHSVDTLKQSNPHSQWWGE